MAFGAAIGVLAAQEVRFDHVVRNDFFAGFSGNREALSRGMEKTQAVIEKDPNHAEALVWHGAGLVFQSGDLFQKGEQQKGIEQYMKGMAMMDKAVALAPKAVGVRVPRGSVLMQASFGMPPEMAKPVLEKALDDYMTTYDVQKAFFDKVGEHPRGELLFGIANSYRRLGDEAKANEWFKMITDKMPNTNYAKRADIWLTTKSLTPAQQRCVGCHVDK
ncbi:hypothetical protein F183_A31950 [Bryobacterales bacterium F-183]|nr:hypothetical protein F183_A31950 [Bryobacterales bacterium F-183]